MVTNGSILKTSLLGGQDVNRAAGYRRVSSKAQSDDGESLLLQEQMITEYIARQGWELTEIYADKGISGKSIEGRKALQRLLGDATNGVFDAVVIHSLSRFGRNTRDLLSNLEHLKRNNVSLISLKENIDFSTTTGQLIFTVLGAVSELERETIRERTMENRIARGKRGVPTAGKIPFARRYDKVTGNWTLDEEKAGLIRWAADQYLNNGKSLRDISETFRTQHKLRLGYHFLITVLRDKSGDTWTVNFRGEEPITYNVPRILDDQTIQAIKERLEHNTIHNRHDVKRYALTGFVRCGRCGKALAGQTQVNRVRSIFEYYRHPGGKYERCKALNSVPLKVIEKTVFRSIFENTHDQPSFDKAINDSLPDAEYIESSKARIAGTKKELKRIELELEKLVDSVLAGTLRQETIQKKETELYSVKQRLTGELEEDEWKLRQLPSAESVYEESQIVRRQLMLQFQSAEHLESMSFEEKKRLLHWLFDGKDDEGTPYGIYVDKVDRNAWDCFLYGRLVCGIAEVMDEEAKYKTSCQGCFHHHDLHACAKRDGSAEDQKPSHVLIPSR
jgi:site-specific DNA recombinase